MRLVLAQSTRQSQQASETRHAPNQEVNEEEPAESAWKFLIAGRSPRLVEPRPPRTYVPI
jgi:hypothetical protein